LGFLSQLTFAYLYAGFIAWSALAFWDRRWVDKMLTLHSPIVLLLICLYAAQLRFFSCWGGPHMSLGEFVSEFTSASFNTPLPWIWLALALVGLVIAAPRGDWPFFVVMMASAAVAVSIRISENVAPRYIAILIPFLLALIAICLDAMLRRRGILGAAAVLLLLCFGAGGIEHGLRAYPLKYFGYSDAIARAGPNPSFGTDSGMDKFLANFYCQRMNVAMAETMPPRWWIVGWNSAHPLETIVRNASAYRLVAVCPAVGPTWQWSVYKREVDSSITTSAKAPSS
jgi:hypothetical protein